MGRTNNNFEDQGQRDAETLIGLLDVFHGVGVLIRRRQSRPKLKVRHAGLPDFLQGCGLPRPSAY